MDDSTNFGRERAPQLRVGDAERQAAADMLQAHFAAGRITWDELDERLGQAWAARTQADLTPLFADLPAERVAVRPASKGELVRDLRQHLPVRPEFLVLALLLMVGVFATDGVLLAPLAFLFVFTARHRGRYHHYRHSDGGHHGMRG